MAAEPTAAAVATERSAEVAGVASDAVALDAVAGAAGVALPGVPQTSQ